MSKTILVVDDSPNILDKLEFVLVEEGYTVLKALNGKQGLELLNGQTIDLIITDFYMPELDGIEFTKTVRTISYYKHTPILFLTTESQMSNKMQAKDAGATGWIIKPFMPAKLIASVKKVLR